MRRRPGRCYGALVLLALVIDGVAKVDLTLERQELARRRDAWIKYPFDGRPACPFDSDREFPPIMSRGRVGSQEAGGWLMWTWRWGRPQDTAERRGSWCAGAASPFESGH